MILRLSFCLLEGRHSCKLNGYFLQFLPKALTPLRLCTSRVLVLRAFPINFCRKVFLTSDRPALKVVKHIPGHALPDFPQRIQGVCGSVRCKDDVIHLS